MDYRKQSMDFISRFISYYDITEDNFDYIYKRLDQEVSEKEMIPLLMLIAYEEIGDWLENDLTEKYLDGDINRLILKKYYYKFKELSKYKYDRDMNYTIDDILNAKNYNTRPSYLFKDILKTLENEIKNGRARLHDDNFISGFLGEHNKKRKYLKTTIKNILKEYNCII